MNAPKDCAARLNRALVEIEALVADVVRKDPASPLLVPLRMALVGLDDAEACLDEITRPTPNI